MGARESRIARITGVALATAVVALGGGGGPLAAQDLADFDYENLSFRGVGLDVGYIWPSTVEPVEVYNLRVDLGFLGPSLRVLPRISYWDSEMEDDEIAELERSVERLIRDQRPGDPGTVDLGRIDRSDLVVGVDAHVLFNVPLGFLSYAGLGGSVHFLNGSGPAVDDTFVEDLLDSASAGFNLHAGLERPVSDRVRFYGEGRLDVLGDLYYPGVKLGIQLMTQPPIPGELGVRRDSGGYR